MTPPGDELLHPHDLSDEVVGDHLHVHTLLDGELGEVAPVVLRQVRLQVGVRAEQRGVLLRMAHRVEKVKVWIDHPRRQPPRDRNSVSRCSLPLLVVVVVACGGKAQAKPSGREGEHGALALLHGHPRRWLSCLAGAGSLFPVADGPGWAPGVWRPSSIPEARLTVRSWLPREPRPPAPAQSPLRTGRWISMLLYGTPDS